MRRVVQLGAYIDLRRSLHVLRHGANDPTVRLDESVVWRATRTPDGPATASYRLRPGEASVQVEVWGAGGSRLLEHAPALLGVDDAAADFATLVDRHRIVHELHRRLPGLRVIRSNAVFEALVPTILRQRVTSVEATRAWRQLVFRYGEPAPGPSELRLRLPPDPDVLATVPYHDLHRLGVERQRAETLRRASAQARRIEEAVSMPLADARRRLVAIAGVGSWTAAEVAAVALGDPDAVPVGDYHMPHDVAWALAGEPRGSDERMLELLAPFAGHRGRVCQLVAWGGRHAPRRGPRLPVSRMREW
ncbi:MAG: DNA-3-methyladenine glycosylase family protein [Acidimicrobiales bacterium]